jgi:TATA-box binding protein (TBP) (component of TFIID and TFIIIB)
MSGVDDEWTSFLTQGAIILSNEKNSAKNNVTNSYQKNMDSTMTSYTAIIDTNNVVLKSPTSISEPVELYKPTHGPHGPHGSHGSHVPGLSKVKPSKQTINLSSLKKVENNIHSKKNTIKPKKCNINSDDDDGELGHVDDIGDLGNLEELDDIDLDDLDEFDTKIPNIINTTIGCEEQQPVCSNIYISTKTKISYLNEPIDIKKVFWNIPISPYSTPNECIIKKQIKVSTTDPKELEEIRELLKNEKYYQEQEIEHIDNPEGRIKFKVQLKINVGLCKKDILNYRCKLKRAFFNCFVLIMRIRDQSGEGFKEMHIKVFNTGKLEIPGIQTDESLTQVLKLLITILRPLVGPHIDFIPDKCETVLINSNFNCGYFINRDRLYNILKYKYRINSNYDACSYPGIQSKFYYIPGLEHQTGQHPPTSEIDKAYEISFMIFRTGSVLIVGRCDENVLHCIYAFLKKLLEVEYPEIGNQLNIIQPKKQNVKLRRKVINVVEDI